jgi:hypothetical protein
MVGVSNWGSTVFKPRTVLGRENVGSSRASAAKDVQAVACDRRRPPRRRSLCILLMPVYSVEDYDANRPAPAEEDP